MDDLGLISVLPPAFLAALLLLTVSFAFATCARRVDGTVLFAHVAVLIVILYGTLPIVEDVPRQLAVWRHLGVSDYIVHHGSVDGTIDAYYNWPGFFALGAFWREIAGIPNLIEIAHWTTPILNFFYLLPLVVLYRSHLRESRHVWLTLWIFYCCNWVAQDHWSPQGFGYLLYLTIVTVLVAMLAPKVGSARAVGDSRVASGLKGRVRATQRALRTALQHEPPLEWSRLAPLQRSSLMAVAVTLFFAMAISHQLTPYSTALSLLGLTLIGATSARVFAVTATVFVMTWFAYGAVPYLKRFLQEDSQNLGEVTQNLSSSLAGRLKGSPEHLFIVNMRVYLTLLIGALALAGILYRVRQGKRDGAFLVLAVAPAVLVALQPYGGEILIRSYYFALPGVAFFVGAFASKAFGFRDSRLGPVFIACLSLVLLAGFLYARYGNERLDYFTEDEYRAVEYLYDHVPDRSIIWMGEENFPWLYRRYRAFPRVIRRIPGVDSWEDRATRNVDPHAVARDMIFDTRELADRELPDVKHPRSFVIITRGMEARIDFDGSGPPGSLRNVERVLSRSADYRLLYRNRDAAVFELVFRRGGTGVDRSLGGASTSG